MGANRITITIDKNTNKLAYTEAVSCDTILPCRIIQHLYELKEDTLGYTISRMDIMDTLLDMFELKNQRELSNLYTDTEWVSPITWIEFAYLVTYVFELTDVKHKGEVTFETTIPVCARMTKTGIIDESILSYKPEESTLTEYLEDIRLGGSYMPISLYIAYKLLQKKISITNNMMFKQITNQNMASVRRLGKRGQSDSRYLRK